MRTFASSGFGSCPVAAVALALGAVDGAVLAAGVFAPHAATATPAAMTAPRNLMPNGVDITLTSSSPASRVERRARNVLRARSHRLRSHDDRGQRPSHRVRAARR